MKNGKPVIDLTQFILDKNVDAMKRMAYWDGYNACLQEIIQLMSKPNGKQKEKPADSGKRDTTIENAIKQ